MDWEIKGKILSNFIFLHSPLRFPKNTFSPFSEKRLSKMSSLSKMSPYRQLLWTPFILYKSVYFVAYLYLFYPRLLQLYENTENWKSVTLDDNSVHQFERFVVMEQMNWEGQDLIILMGHLANLSRVILNSIFTFVTSINNSDTWDL